MDGDDGFARWYEAEQPRLYATLAAITGDRDVSADAADEALARAYERWSTVSQMASPAGWTYTTGLNVVRRTMRRRAFEQRAREVLRLDRPAVAPELDVVSPELLAALLALPERTRTVIALFYVADRPVDEIAEVLGVATSTVTSTLSVGRDRLRALMNEGAVT